MSGFYVIEATAAPGKTLEALQSALMKALKQALQAEPSESELLRAKNAYKKGFYNRIEAVDSRASLLASYVLHAGRADYISEDLARYTSATPAAVHEAAKKWIDLDSFVRIDFVPRKDKQKKGASAGMKK
jgi:predicted Zn-dependent peptidase